MLSRRGLQIASLVWAIIGWSVALTGLGQVNADARLLVAAASAAFPLAAVGAFPALDRGMDRTAGALLIVSAATPTYFAYAINLPALLVGLVLLIWPALVVGQQGTGSTAPATHT